MSDLTKNLDNLLRERKESNKKEPSQSDKTSYTDNWMELVHQEGFSVDAEKYLYDGFWFCGTEAYYGYIKSSSIPTETLSSLFQGRYYGKDSNVTFRILTHLLALMLNDNAPSELLAPIIAHFPSACVNKENKRLGTAVKTIEKYFLGTISPSATFLPLSEIELSTGVKNMFVTTLASLLKDLTASGPVKANLAVPFQITSKWLGNYSPQLIEKHSVPASDTNRTVVAESLSPSSGTSNSSVNTDNESLSQILVKAQTISSHLEKEMDALKHRLINLQEKETSLTSRLNDAEKQIAEHQRELKEVHSQRFMLSQKCTQLESEAKEKDRIIMEKDAEISERIKMSEMLSRDRSRQADETLQRLASKIRIEYRDFEDAVNAEMTVDLGENLRLQLLSIFEILEKGGMKIK